MKLPGKFMPSEAIAPVSRVKSSLCLSWFLQEQAWRILQQSILSIMPDSPATQTKHQDTEDQMQLHPLSRICSTATVRTQWEPNPLAISQYEPRLYQNKAKRYYNITMHLNCNSSFDFICYMQDCLSSVKPGI